MPKQTLNAAQKNAQHYFRKAEAQPDTLAKQLRKKEHVAGAANTARLRELRLAKEAAEKQATDNSAPEKAGSPATRQRRSVLRMSY